MDLINKYLQEQTPGHEYEYDYEGDMAKTQLNMMIDASMELKSMLQNNTNLPEWVQSKITKAADYIDSARDYMKNMNKDSNGNMHNEPMGEQTMSDTGWKASQKTRKDQYGNVQKTSNVAKSLARKAMKSAISDIKKGPEAGKRQVEGVEDLEELKKDTLNKYITRTRFSSDPKRRMGAQRAMARVGQKPKEEKPVKTEEVELDESLRNKLAAMGVAATMAASPAAARVTDGGQSFAQQTAQQTTQPQSVKAPKEIPSKSYLQNVASGKSRSMMHPDTAKEMLKKHYSEDVDLVSKYSKLGEGRFPGFRSSSKTGGGWSRSVRMRGVHTAQPSYDQDPRTGLPLGFSNPPKSDKPEDEKDKVKK